jgi:hypothetical protein
MKVVNIKNRGGRPRVDATPIMVRLPPTQVAALDDWRRNETDLPTRPEAIRRILAQALAAKGKR